MRTRLITASILSHLSCICLIKLIKTLSQSDEQSSIWRITLTFNIFFRTFKKPYVEFREFFWRFCAYMYRIMIRESVSEDNVSIIQHTHNYQYHEFRVGPGLVSSNIFIDIVERCNSIISRQLTATVYHKCTYTENPLELLPLH